MKDKELFEQRKDKLNNLVANAGYKSFRSFAKDVGITSANLYSNIDGTYNMSMKRMFRVAEVLNVPILQIIDIFYPEELAKNMDKF